MLVGSFASSAHGSPRATQDIDIVIDPTSDQLRSLISHFPPSEFYVSPEAASEALARRTQFNLIHLPTGWKVDLIIRKDRPFSFEELGRRRATMVGETQLDVATAEDTIIAKLEWAKLGGSTRQLEDVAGIVRQRGDELDIPYLDHWIAELRLTSEWTRALAMVTS